MNRNVLITGASRGLGLALAVRFAGRGDQVFAVSRTERHWKQAWQTLPDSGLVTWIAADITNEADVKGILKIIRKETGHLHLVINNAGYGGKLAAIDKIPRLEWERHLAANLTAAFLVSKEALPLVRKSGGGQIFNISSMAGTRAVPRLAAYSAAKFGLMALTQALAKENTDFPFKALTICPGGMNTEMRRVLFGAEDAAKQQSPDFVADLIIQIIDNKIPVENGAAVVIRNGKITAIQPMPGA